MTPTVVILCDALRPDYISANCMPFLQSIRERSVFGRIRASFAYQPQTCWFCGLHPETSGRGFLMWYAPQHSPFKFMRYARPLQPLLRQLPGWVGRERKVIEFIARRTTSAASLRAYMSTAQIPFRLLPKFDFPEKKFIWQENYWQPDHRDSPTLFDILRQNEVPWIVSVWPPHRCDAMWVLNRFLREIESRTGFVYLHIGNVDWAQHAFGPFSPEVKSVLRVVDAAIEQIFKVSIDVIGAVNFLVFGDHGAVEVTEYCDLEALLEKLPRSVLHDISYFIDSLIIRFWFQSERAQDAVLAMLRSLGKVGTVLTREHLRRWHASYAHQRNGELFFQAKPGVLFFPNFYQRKNRHRGTHGYGPEVQDNDAAFVMYDGENVGELGQHCEMVDLFPTILHLLELPLPASNQGRSVYEQL